MANITYDKRKKLGLCPRCGKNPPDLERTYCRDCRENAKRHYDALPVDVREGRWESFKKWTKENPDKVRAREKKFRKRVRLEVITHYGGVCACCGESNIEFLTIDHIDGGGNKHRRSLGGSKGISSHRFYRKIRHMGYPEGLQVLCANCNMAKARLGTCPHQQH